MSTPSNENPWNGMDPEAVEMGSINYIQVPAEVRVEEFLARKGINSPSGIGSPLHQGGIIIRPRDVNWKEVRKIIEQRKPTITFRDRIRRISDTFKF